MKQPMKELEADDILAMGDTRWRRLIELAESQRRERVANEIVRLCDSITAATNYTSTVLSRLPFLR